MELSLELESKSAPRIMKAATKIADGKLEGYEVAMLNTLEFLLTKKPKSWKAQSELIRVIGVTGSERSLPYLKELTQQEFRSTILYRYLGFSICLLEDISCGKLSYLNSILEIPNKMLVSGACSALLFSEFIPEKNDIIKILENVVDYDGNEGQVITARCYIAAACYSWPKQLTKDFLITCSKSNWAGLSEITEASLAGIKTKYVLV